VVDPNPFALVLTTAGSEERAVAVARALVEGRRAACVNVVPRVRSIYRWQGAVHDDTEWLLIVKIRREDFDEVRRAILDAHDYDTPEVVALPVIAGDPRYLAWLDDAVRSQPG